MKNANKLPGRKSRKTMLFRNFKTLDISAGYKSYKMDMTVFMKRTLFQIHTYKISLKGKDCKKAVECRS